MGRLVSSAVVVLLALVGFESSAAAQGVQTGSVRGVVRDAAGLVLPQATVRAESPVLQGNRETVADQAGAYQLTGLAPGLYTITFEFSGLQSVTSALHVGVGTIESLDAGLHPASVAEAVTVTAATPSMLARATGGTSLRASEIDALPTGRTP